MAEIITIDGVKEQHIIIIITCLFRCDIYVIREL